MAGDLLLPVPIPCCPVVRGMRRLGSTRSTGMGARHELTWFAPRKCWKKKYRKKVYYTPTENRGKSDWDGYKAALGWWERKKKELDGEHERDKQSEEMFLSGAELEVVLLANQRARDYEADPK